MGGEVADDEDGGMAQVLELAELAERNAVSEMQVPAGGVYTELDAELLAGRKFFCQVFAAYHVYRAPENAFKYFFVVHNY